MNENERQAAADLAKAQLAEIEIAKLTRQRDELLEAAKGIIENIRYNKASAIAAGVHSCLGIGPVMKLKAAIKNAEPPTETPKA